MDDVTTDLLIIGAGPTGLFAAYYAGFRGMSVAVVDSLPELGGQITAMYPEKAILDVAGFPSVKGRDLVEGLVAQAATADPTYLLDRTATTLEHGDDEVVVTLDDGTRVTAGAVLITSGIGKFSPRPLPAGDGWVGRGMEFFVPSFAPYAGKDVVIVGGGDSAFDWAQHLEPIAASVTLVHRRDAFRAHERTVAEVKDSSVEIITNAQVTALRGDGHLEEVEISVDGQEPQVAQGAGPRRRARLHRRPRRDPAVGPGDPEAPRGRRLLDADQPAAGLRGRRHHRLPRQGAADRRRLRRGRDRGQQRGRVLDPAAHVFPGHSSEA